MADVIPFSKADREAARATPNTRKVTIEMLQDDQVSIQMALSFLAVEQARAGETEWANELIRLSKVMKMGVLKENT